MVCLFPAADDLHDAATDAARVLNDRLSRRGLQLEPASYEALRQILTGALQMAEVEEVGG